MDQVSQQRFRIFAIFCGIFLLSFFLVYSTNASIENLKADFVNSLEYLSPRPGAKQVSRGTTIALRTKDSKGQGLFENLTISVHGSASGIHDGETLLAKDGETIIFKPDNEFSNGETVTVFFNSGVDNPHQSFRFYIAENTIPGSTTHLQSVTWPEDQVLLERDSNYRTDDDSSYITAPASLPKIDVLGNPELTGDGYIFINYFGNVKPLGLILDNTGEPVYYTPPGFPHHLDFKKQSNGLLTHFSPKPEPRRFYAYDNSYQLVRTYQAGNGYSTDNHDLTILDNGNALLLVYDRQIIDMSQLIVGGNPEAVVIGCVAQELDIDGNVIFEWRSWDHISILDVHDGADLTAKKIDYIHCNSIEEDFDGNLLISSRHLDEVTKIDRSTAENIWRMGGKKNQFEFTNDPGFNYQHDARRLANGNITVYDNGVGHDPQYSRGVEYFVDEENMKVTRVAEFRKDPDKFASAMGNMQTLPNENVVIGWGTSRRPLLTEFDRDGNVIFEILATEKASTYRAFRFPWQGIPSYPPNLVAQVKGKDITLFFSWNGSTETEKYDVLGGRNREILSRIGQVDRESFESSFEYTIPMDGLYYFQVVPINKFGIKGKPSNLAPVVVGGQPLYLPVVFGR